MRATARRRQIESVVEQLLKQAGISSPPIPVEKLAENRGAEIRYVPFEGSSEDVSGMLYQDAGKTIIGVNLHHRSSRQRFTIAHELGHLCLHAVDRLYLDRDFRVTWRNGVSSLATDMSEIEANEFAADLLMPGSMLRRDLDGRSVDYEEDDVLRGLADRYNVSLQAMVFRLTNLGLIGRMG